LRETTDTAKLLIRHAVPNDVPLILDFIKQLATYESLSYEVVATEEGLQETLFGSEAKAEVLLAYAGDHPAGFALFFHNYSTFLGKPGIYLEDLFVKEEFRGCGFGKALVQRLAQIAQERNGGRLEWWVLDWNESAIEFYKKLGAKPMNEWTTFRITGEELDRLAGN